MELRQLTSFIALAEEGNFGRAAARLHLSTSGLSQQIRALERSLDVNLFERTRAGALLTPAGAELVHQARQVLGAAETAVAATRARASGQPSGPLSILVDADAAPLLDRWFADFTERCPAVDLQLQIVGDRTMRELTARSSSWHLALSWTAVAAAPRRHVAAVEIVAVLSDDHPMVLEHGDGPLPLDALHRWPLVIFDRDEAPSVHDDLMAILERPADAPTIPIGKIHGPALPATLRALESGPASAFSLFPSGTPVLCAGRCLVRRRTDPPLFLPIHASWPSGQGHPNALALLRHLPDALTAADGLLPAGARPVAMSVRP